MNGIDTYIEGAKKEVGEELAKKYEEEGIAMGLEKAVEYALDFEKGLAQTDAHSTYKPSVH